MEFESCLDGPARTAWNETAQAEIDAAEDGQPAEVGSQEEFEALFAKFIIRLLNNAKPRDLQYVYLHPGGEYPYRKALTVTPLDHKRQLKEMLRTALLLPPGDIPNPSEGLVVQWFYMSFHKSDRAEYIRSGRRLDNETLETLALYFQAIHDAKVADGSLQRQEQQRVANCSQRTDNQRQRNSSSRGPDRRDYSRDREREREC